eukprot:4060557-Amphidinium_carterae.1
MYIGVLGKVFESVGTRSQYISTREQSDLKRQFVHPEVRCDHFRTLWGDLGMQVYGGDVKMRITRHTMDPQKTSTMQGKATHRRIYSRTLHVSPRSRRIEMINKNCNEFPGLFGRYTSYGVRVVSHKRSPTVRCHGQWAYP